MKLNHHNGDRILRFMHQHLIVSTPLPDGADIGETDGSLHDVYFVNHSDRSNPKTKNIGTFPVFAIALAAAKQGVRPGADPVIVVLDGEPGTVEIQGNFVPVAMNDDRDIVPIDEIDIGKKPDPDETNSDEAKSTPISDVPEVPPTDN